MSLAEHPSTGIGKGLERRAKSKVVLTFLNLLFWYLSTLEELDLSEVEGED